MARRRLVTPPTGQGVHDESTSQPRASVSKRPTPGKPTPAPAPEPPPQFEPELDELDDEADHLLCVLRDQLRRADAFVTSAETELLVSWGVGGDDGSGEDDEADDDGVQRRRMRVEYLVEAGKLAVREAQYTSEQLAAERRDA